MALFETGNKAEKKSDRFESIITARYNASQLMVRFDDRGQTLPPEVVKLIDAEWQHQTALAEKEGRTLFDGVMLRLDSFHRLDSSRKGSGLQVSLSRSRYKYFVGTNLTSRKQKELISPDHYANPLGLSALIVCADSKLLLGLRGKGTFLYSGYWHTFGGMADMQDVGVDGNVSLFNVIARELNEELGVADEEIEKIRCIGMVRDLAILQPEIIFEVQVSLTSNEIVQRMGSRFSQPNDEHDGIIAIEKKADAVNHFVASHPSQITAVALATLAHYFHLQGERVPAMLIASARKEQNRT